ncbi:DUF6343 family protein [Streptomyces sp. UNOC14_S4]|uniref:DUF6343 family protein n=1 Tax=Streptomyces sp. UNOC14_S4 TaxID=2872340 RepID=UPI001E45B158|nr:DUF6343 family protein [Streptomyces sp. UNOC14_S4]MCC3768458.1 hypothetical protein [Streptomyces sp. UNOC14_S4]
MRTGNEPMNARSALRLRCGLAAWGLAWAIGGTVLFAVAGHPGWAIACAVLVVVTAVDLAVVIHRIRQGPHFQPGRDVPPYEPVRRRDDR